MLGFFAQSAPELEPLSLPFRVVRQHRQLLQALVELRGRFRHRRAGGRSPTGLAPTATGASSTNSWATGSWQYLARRSTIPPPEAGLVEKSVVCWANCPRLLLAGYSAADLHVNSWLEDHHRVHGSAKRKVLINNAKDVQTQHIPRALVFGGSDGDFPPHDPEQIQEIIDGLKSL